jgi:hypothetical protein
MWLRQQAVQPELTDDGEVDDIDSNILDPESMLLQNRDREMLSAALDDIPVEFREVIVLREMEELSYKEIADITGVPVGTVQPRRRESCNGVHGVRPSSEISDLWHPLSKMALRVSKPLQHLKKNVRAAIAWLSLRAHLRYRILR